MAMSPRLLRPLASGFSPRSIPGLAAWLDASVSSSVTLDGNGKVSTWTDLTGNGRNATQTTADNRATYTTAGFGGKNCLTFDGSNASSRMVLGDLSAAFPTYGEVIIAYEAVSDTGYSLYTTKALADALIFSGGHFIGTFVSVRFSPSPNTSNVPTNGSAVVSMRSTGSTFVLRRNGTQDFSHTGSTFEAGTVHTLANRAEGEAGLAFNGKIGEVLLFNADMGNVNRAKAEGYLAWKWGMQSQLPSNHPYAYSFPGFGSQPRPSNADALAWESAVYSNSGSTSVGTLAAVNTFCDAIDAAGIRDRFARLNLFCGSSLNAALVPLYKSFTFGGASLGNATDTNVGPFVSGDYSESVGLLKAGNTNSYLDTGLATDDLPTAATGHMAAWMGTHSPAAFLYVMGSDTAAAQRYWLVSWTTGGSSVVRAQWGQNVSATSSGLGATIPAGLYIGTRTSSTALDVYGDGASLATTASSVTPAAISNNFYVAAANNNGVAGSFATFPLAGYSIGESLTAEQAAAYNTIYKALISALGRPLT